MSVCLSAGGKFCCDLLIMHWTSLYRLLPISDMASNQYWHLVTKTGNLFKLVHFNTLQPPLYWHLGTKTRHLFKIGHLRDPIVYGPLSPELTSSGGDIKNRTVSKRVEHFLLECFLVVNVVEMQTVSFLLLRLCLMFKLQQFKTSVIIPYIIVHLTGSTTSHRFLLKQEL